MGLFDDVDTESTLGNAASGALTGLAAGGPVGALVGGVGGLVSGLFTKKKKPPKFDDPYKAQRDLAISDLMSGNYGQKAASVESGQIGNLARDQVEDEKNNSKFAGNAAVQSAMQNKILTNAERGSQSAYVRGAQIDSENRSKAASLSAQGSELAQNQFKMNQDYADRPSFGQQMLQSVLSTGTGAGLSKLLAPGSTANPDAGGNNNNDAGTNSQGTGLYDKMRGSNGSNPLNYSSQSLNFDAPFNGALGYDNESGNGFPGDPLSRYMVTQ